MTDATLASFLFWKDRRSNEASIGASTPHGRDSLNGAGLAIFDSISYHTPAEIERTYNYMVLRFTLHPQQDISFFDMFCSHVCHW